MKTKIILAFLSLSICSLKLANAQCNGADFEERNGIAVYELENKNVPSAWKKETTASGFSGSSYLAYRGTNYFGNPGNNVITYKVKINSPGVYRVQWRNKVGIGNNGTEHNDSWLKFTDSFDFFGRNGNTIKYPKGGKFRKSSAVVNGSSGNGWMKIYNAGGINWNWTSFTSDNEGLKVYAEFTSSGVYTFQVSGRSNGHFIDRIVLYKEGSYSEGSATSASRSTTNCSGGNTGGDTGGGDTGGDTGGGDTGGDTGGNDNVDQSPQSPTVTINNPANGQVFTEGTTISVTLSANDPDGNITKHEIFVDGTKVDTDGATYSAHKINNVMVGSYEVKARVTDNGGNTAEDTVSFSVEADTTNDGNTDNGNTGGDNSNDGNTDGGNNNDDNTGNDGSNDGEQQENQNPTVSITGPTEGDTIEAGSNVSITLSASDTDGSIAQHVVMVNGNVVDTDGADYSAHIISEIAEGEYTVKVIVTDDNGGTAEDTVTFLVEKTNQTPQVSITKPLNNASITEGETLAVELNVSDPDGDEDIDKVIVKIADQEITLNEAPFQTQIQGLAIGEYTLEVTVSDKSGASETKSVSVNVVEIEEAPIALPQIQWNVHTFNYLVDGQEITSELKVLSIEILDQEGSHTIEITGPNEYFKEVTTEVGTATLIENLELGTYTISIPSENKEITKTFSNED